MGIISADHTICLFIVQIKIRVVCTMTPLISYENRIILQNYYQSPTHTILHIVLIKSTGHLVLVTIHRAIIDMLPLSLLIVLFCAVAYAVPVDHRILVTVSCWVIHAVTSPPTAVRCTLTRVRLTRDGYTK